MKLELFLKSENVNKTQHWFKNKLNWNSVIIAIQYSSTFSLRLFILIWTPASFNLHTTSSFSFSSVQSLSSVRFCNPMNCSTPGLPVHHQLPGSTQIHVHRVSDAIWPSHPLLSPSPPALNLFQHQGLFKWVSSSHQVAKVLEFQLQHQSFQWTPRTDLL